MNRSHSILRIPADFLREARRLFGRLRVVSGPAAPAAPSVVAGARFPVEVRGAFDGISLALGDGDCWLESFRHATGEAGGHGRFLLPWQALADACRADPGTVVEVAACPRTEGTVLRLRCGGVRLVRFHPAAGGQAMPPPALPDGELVHLPARSMEAIAAVASFADWQAPAGPWQSGVCFSPAGGGCLIAGNGQRLARVPLQLPELPPGFASAFVLPLGAVRVLLHPDFLGYENQLTLPRCGAEPRVMFRAWDHLLVSPVLAAGRLEDESRLGEAGTPAGHPWLLDALRRVQLLDWLRALRDPHTPVSLAWRDGGRLTIVQGEGRGRAARLNLSGAFRGERPAVLPPRLLAAATRPRGRAPNRWLPRGRHGPWREAVAVMPGQRRGFLPDRLAGGCGGVRWRWPRTGRAACCVSRSIPAGAGSGKRPPRTRRAELGDGPFSRRNLGARFPPRPAGPQVEASPMPGFARTRWMVRFFNPCPEEGALDLHFFCGLPF